MRTLASLLATAALVGGVTIASAQSGSPTAPSGPNGRRRQSPHRHSAGRSEETVELPGRPKGAGASPTQGSGSPTAPSGPGPGC